MIYHDDIQEYICNVQQIFCACLIIFFCLHTVVTSILDFLTFQELNSIIWIFILQIFLSLIGYFLFKYYFASHRKHVAKAAYFNIFQVIVILELQYFFYDEFIPYTIILCIILSTSITIIGHIRGYISIIALTVFLDIIITLIKNYENIHTYSMYRYIIDSFFVILSAAGLNFCVSWIKYKDFAKKQQIVYLSERDSLTTLLNRRALEYFVQKHSKVNALCAMILIDIDNFKSLNDTLGHYEGDNCLCAVSNELKRIFCDTDYVSRLGGDEFMIFMPDLLSKDCAIKKAERILEKIPRTYPYSAGEILITCSIGIAFSQSECDDLYEKLYKDADSAMYVSKTKGKNTMTICENNHFINHVGNC